MEMMSTLWNIVLSLLIGIVSWVLKEKAAEVQRLSILLNRTREEVAKEYVTKAEVHADINRVLNRLDVIDAKLDRFVEQNFSKTR
jgi:archaellum component FlaC